MLIQGVIYVYQNNIKLANQTEAPAVPLKTAKFITLISLFIPSYLVPKAVPYKFVLK